MEWRYFFVFLFENIYHFENKSVKIKTMSYMRLTMTEEKNKNDIK